MGPLLRLRPASPEPYKGGLSQEGARAMTWNRAVLVVAVAYAIAGGGLAAQDLPEKNPFEGNPDAVRAGMGGFRQRCADCHGTDAHGVRGPDITQIWASGRTDQGLFKTIRQGVPNTEMPSFVAPRTS